MAIFTVSASSNHMYFRVPSPARTSCMYHDVLAPMQRNSITAQKFCLISPPYSSLPSVTRLACSELHVRKSGSLVGPNLHFPPPRFSRWKTRGSQKCGASFVRWHMCDVCVFKCAGSKIVSCSLVDQSTPARTEVTRVARR